MTSSKRPDQWIFPGGGVEPEEDSSVTAVREVAEEAGVTGKLDRFLGIFEVRVSIVLNFAIIISLVEHITFLATYMHWNVFWTWSVDTFDWYFTRTIYLCSFLNTYIFSIHNYTIYSMLVDLIYEKISPITPSFYFNRFHIGYEFLEFLFQGKIHS